AIEFTEARCSIGFRTRAPPNQGTLGEDEVGRRENREEMPARRVEPGGAERNKQPTVLAEEGSHQPERTGGGVGVLEAVERDGDIGTFFGAARKGTWVRYFVGLRMAPSSVEHMGADVDSNHSCRAARRNSNSLRAETAAEIDHDLVQQFAPNLRTK